MKNFKKNLIKFAALGLLMLLLAAGIMPTATTAAGAPAMFSPIAGTAFLTAAGSPSTVLAAAGSPGTDMPEDSRRVDVLFLHDTHSHLDSFLTMEDEEVRLAGGFAHIKTLINEAKEHNPHTLILDGGDFSMGTLVQTIFHSDAPELRMLGALGCDVSTLGNHEFDYRSQGLASALNAAAASGDPVPALALCNIDWAAMEAEGLTEEQQLLKNAFDNYGLKDYVIVQKGDVRIAVLGIFGEDSLSCAPTCVLKFRDASEAAAETIARIKATENVDMIACVSHSGTWADEKKSEDEILAKNVPELDLIISAHTHTALTEPIRHGDTYIVSCGSYGVNLGSLSMHQSPESGRWVMDSYALIPVDRTIAADAPAQEKIDGFMEKVDASYLSQFGYDRKQVLAQNAVAFSPLRSMSTVHTEQNLGSIMSDAFTYAVENAPDFDGVPVAVSLVPSGCVRGTFVQGDITVEDVFNSYSLGVGMDGIPGYPLISIYVTGAEIKTSLEIDASVSDIMTTARLYLSGLNFTYNPHRLFLNRVTDCYFTDDDGNRIEIENDRLYRVVCDLYSGQMLGAATDVSYGLLSIQPKFADGTPIENIEDAIITSNGSEIKAWAAIAGYLDSFEDTDGDGISNVPAFYAENQGRKVVDDSTSLASLLKKPNKFAVMVAVLVLVLLLLLLLLIVGIIKRIRRRRKQRVN